MKWRSCGDIDLFFNVYAEREQDDSERSETKFSAGVTVKFTAQTTLKAEERQPGCSQKHSKCEQENWEVVSESERIVPFRLDQFWVEADTMGFSHPSIFIPSPLRPHERRPLASRSEQVSAFFSLLNKHNVSHGKFSMGYRRAKSTQGNTNFRITTRGP